MPSQNAVWAIYTQNKQSLLQTVLSKDKPNKDERYLKKILDRMTDNKPRQRSNWARYESNCLELKVLQQLIDSDLITDTKHIKGDIKAVQLAYKPVINKLEEAFKLDPTSTLTCRALAATYFWLQDDKGLQKYSDKLSTIDPKQSYVAKMWLAAMNERNGRLDVAEKLYRQGVELSSDKDNDTPKYQLATLLIKKEDQRSEKFIERNCRKESRK